MAEDRLGSETSSVRKGGQVIDTVATLSDDKFKNSPTRSPATNSKESIEPRYEQAPLVTDGDSGISMTHAHTTIPSAQGKSQYGSLYSYVSDRDINQFVRELHGRTWNSSNAAYLLPSDEPEWIRLDKQHSALVIGFDGLYPCPEIVDLALSPLDSGEPRHILDVGCGTGAWAMEMAHKFPHALVLGIDMAPVPCDSSLFPPNISFELDDINNGLSHYRNRFDCIHMRCVAGGITDTARTMEELEDCLKPGGVLIVIDGDNKPVDKSGEVAKPVKVDGDADVTGVVEKGSWWARMSWEATEACVLAGSSINTTMAKEDSGPWDDPLCDPKSTVCGSLYLPIGPWAEGVTPMENQMFLYAGTLMQQVLLNVHTAFHSIMLRQGMDQPTLDVWSEHTQEELTSLKHKMWVRFRFFVTRRRQGGDLPTPPLSSKSGNTLSASGPDAGTSSIERPRYPVIKYYHTREEAKAAIQDRMASAGELPQPAVERAWLGMQSNAQT